MRLLSQIVFAGVSLVFAQAVSAAQDSRGDYAYGMALETDAEAAIYELLLPESVYAGSVHSDLRDVRVVNADGELLPSLIESTDGDGNTRKETQQKLPFFFLQRTLDEKRNANIHIRTGKDGAIVNIIDKRGKTESGRQWVYIVDMSAEAGKVRSLQLQWKQTPANRIIPLHLSTSDDLNHWQGLGSASVSYLQHEGRQLQRNVIDLPPTKARYLQLSSDEELGDYRLAAITARVEDIKSDRSQLQTRRLEAGLDAEGKALVYDAGALLPVSRLNLDFGRENGVADVQAYGRASGEGEWRRLGSATFYTYHVGQQTSQSEPLSLSPQMLRYFRLLPGDRQLLSGRLPQLTLGWHPHRLSFLARGRGPYMLVYGRADSAATDTALGKLVGRLDEGQQQASIAQARPTVQQALCGTACLKPAPAGIDYTRYILWAVIVAGVLLVLWVVVRLYRDMNLERPNSRDETD